MTLLNTRPAPSTGDAPEGAVLDHHPLRHYDVVIVGGGIVGLTLASALRRAGLSLAVIEAQTPAQAASRPRAYAFSPTSAEIFQQLGLWEQVSPHLTHFQKVQLSDGDHPTVVTFQPKI
jgi:2-octaprenyl-6-methoxyphenol hydroxylase